MASRIRNPDWQEDAELKQDLKRYILQNLSRREILDFVSRDYAQYAWSLGSLSRRLAYFDIKYIEYNTDLKEVEAALQSELQFNSIYLPLTKKIQHKYIIDDTQYSYYYNIHT